MLLPELTRAVSRVAPAAIAIVTDVEQLSYAELEGRSSAGAAALTARGIGRGAVVAVAMTRGPELVIALLSVLKAGAAYLPIEPSIPQQRRDLLLDDAGARLLLTDHVWQSMVRAEPMSESARPLSLLRPDDLAYVIYTSGSTGKPKGVEISHGALANFLAAMQRAPGIGAADRVLAHTTIAFDIHVLEMWLPLTVGATVVLVDRETAMNPSALARTIEAARVTVIQATPALWAMLLRAGWSGRGLELGPVGCSASGKPSGVLKAPSSVLKALCGGEALPRDLADALLATGVELWNMYGPTETTVWSTVWRVRPGEPIAIGEPIAQTTVHIFSDALEEPPVGETGEIWIGGAGLARGYRGRPDLTADRFVVHPRSDVGRIYRTGDLARRLPNGSIEYLGRLDQQVKIAGHRIEPGEIEVALRRLPGVRDAIVVAVGAGTALHRLVAYLVTEAPVTPAAVREALALSLPDYMIPSVYVAVPSLPLTPNGKVDRRALPPPEVNLGALREGRQVAHPETPTEAALVPLWQEVLGITELGVDQDFFDLGGHSRLGAYLLALVAQQFGHTLPLSTLVDAPTIRQLARVIDTAVPEVRLATAPVLRLTEAPADCPTLYLVHAAGGHAVIYKALGAALKAQASTEVFQSRGFEGRPDRSSVEDMAATYVAELKRRQPDGPYALGGASFGGVVAYEMARQLAMAGEQIGLLVLFDSELPPLGVSPLVRRLACLPGFGSRLYPPLRRLHAHVTAMGRLGPSAYVAWLFRDRRADARSGSTWRARVGASGDQLLDGLAAVRAVNERALADYIPGTYGGAILFCRARDVSPNPDDTRGRWTELCGEVVYRDVPGDHHTMLLPPHVSQLALIVREALGGQATESSSSASLPLPRQRPRPSSAHPQAGPA